MSSNCTISAVDSLHAVIAGCRAELAGLYAEVAADGAKKMRRWQDESPMLESYIQAMTGTRKILQRETKQMTAEIANLKAFLDKKAAAEAAKQDPALAGSDVANLREHLADLQSKLADLDQQLTELVAQLAGGPAGQAAVRPEERSIYETKLVVLQDTRRLLQAEAAAVSAELKRRESAARLESDKHSAAELGLSDLGRLTEQLAATEAKLDRANVDSYFPRIKGFRFSGGGNGVYFACKDLHLCEVSAAFSLELEALPAQQQHQQHQQVRLKVTLSGISSSSSGQEFKQQQNAHEQQQQAKAAARANSLKRMQPQQQQQQQQPVPLYRSGSSNASQAAAQQLQPPSSSAAAAAAAGSIGSKSTQQLSPGKHQAGSSAATSSGVPPDTNGVSGAAGGAGGGFGQPGSSSSNRRGAAVAKFVGKLSDKRDSLKQAIKAASDDGAERPTAQGIQRGGQAQPAFSRLAETFNDKAAAFGERVSHHSGPMGSTTSGADSASDLAGLGFGVLPCGDISREGSGASATAAAAVRSESASSDALQGAAAVAAAAAAAAGDLIPRLDAAGTRSAHTAAAQASPAAAAVAAAAYPSGLSRSSSNASSASGQRLSADFAASSPGQVGQQGSGLSAGASSRFAAVGSSSPGASEQDSQLKARLQGMKGKFGGLLSESKAKLADSKQKLQQSKLLNESRAAAKHLLADSKVLLEEGKAGLKTKLADSKVLLEVGKVGFKAKLNNISSKLDEHLHHQQHAEHQQAQQQWEQYQLLQQQQMQQQQVTQQPVTQSYPEEAPGAAAPAAGTAATTAAESSAAEPPSADAGSSDAEATQQQQQHVPGQQQTVCDGSSDEQPVPQAAARSSTSTGTGAEAAVPSAAAQRSATSDEVPTGNSADSTANAVASPAVAPAASTPESQASFEAAAAPFPGVAAAAASTGDLDRQLLDESWARDEDGGVGGLARGGSGAAAAAGGGAAAAGVTSGGVAGAKGSAGRRGVVVMLLAEGLEVIGEKGTKVPNIRAAQLGLEVEACLSASLTYSPLLGWQSAGLSFEVLSLERQVQGSNLPLPKTLIKSLLNVVMPSVFTKLLLTSLPHELGKFIIDSSAAAASSSSSSSCKPGPAGVWLAGEVSLAGPPTACLSANLTRTSADVPRGKADIRDFVKELRIAQKARALLDLPDPRHAKALALLLNPGPYSLQPAPLGFNNSTGQGSATAPAAVASVEGVSTAGLSNGSGSGAALGSGLSVSLNDLCRFYLAYSDSAAWRRICGVWQAAVDAVCLQLAQEEGLAAATDTVAGADATQQLPECSLTGAADSNGNSSGADATSSSNWGSSNSSSSSAAASFDFAHLMTGRVAGLVRKPVRLSCGLRQLLLSLDVGAGLAAARDFCERAAKEFAENAKGEDALLLLQRPLSMQLELLHLWHEALSAQLATFAHQFRGAGGRVLLAADRAGFSVAAESCSYEGPLRLEVPLPLLADLAAGCCVWDLALPDPRSAVPTLASKIRFVAAALAKAAFGTCEDEQEALREAAAAEALAAIAAAGDSGHTIEVPTTQAAELEGLLTAWSQQALQQQQQQQAEKAAGSSHGLLRHGGSLPRSNSSNVAPQLAAHAANCLSAAGATPSPPAAAAAAAAGGVACNGSIGRVLLSRLSLGLVLDERRLQELLAGGIKDANLVGGLLGCFGQLFTANLAPGWQKAGPSSDSLSRSNASAAAAAANADASSSSHGAAGEQKSEQQQEPCRMLTVKNNDITRVRAELDSASFVSAVAPRIAVRLLHIVALAVVLKFFTGDSSGATGAGSSSSSKRLEYVNKVFGHIAEYLGRDCLDLLLCLDVAAAANEAGSLQVSVQGISPSAAGTSSSSSSSGNAAAGGGGSSSSPSWPVYVINDVNLLTVLDTVKLIMDYSS